MDIVAAYNGVADKIASFGAQPTVSWFMNGYNYFVREIKTVDGQQAFLVKPLTALGTVYDYFGLAERFAPTNQMANEATAYKAFVSGYKILTLLPGLMKKIDQSGTDAEKTRQYTDLKGDAVAGEVLTLTEVFYKRLSELALAVMAAVDSVKSFKKSYPGLVNQSVEKACSWAYIVTGGYMGIQSFYEESKLSYTKWDGTSSAGKRLTALNLLTSATFIGSSCVSILGIYYGDKQQNWLKQARTITSVGCALLPAVQKIAKYRLGL